MRNSLKAFAGFATVSMMLILVSLSAHIGPIDAMESTENAFSTDKKSLAFDHLGSSSTNSQSNSLFANKWPYARTVWGRELDPNFSNVVNSVFPIDSVISYNDTKDGSPIEIIARYASFSPILSHEMRGHFAVVDGGACSEIDSDLHPQYMNKILIVQRGNCTFVKKLHHITQANLRPLAVVVANNVPHSGLVTMYSKTFDRDEELGFPVLFMSLEDYEDLRKMSPDTLLAIRTASFDGFIGLVLSMAVSPPLMILLCYLVIRAMQLWGRRRRNRRNQLYVRSLPVYIYNRNHLVPTASFYEYLMCTNQTSDIPSVSSSTDELPAGQEFDPSSYVVGGTDLYSMPEMHILFQDKHFYATQKCSICLGRFVPLKSRVLVLSCKHIYHEKCLSNWLINFRKSCPLCNEALQMPETQPFLAQYASNYGTFPVDMERQEPLERHVSNTAVRSLQVSAPVSQAPIQTPLSGSVSHITDTGDASTGSSQGELSAIHASVSNNSFVTTKSQQSTNASRISVPSSYHTSASMAAMDSDDDTQSYESSKSTLRLN
ncbi:hypothetical protein OY671_002218 [Metschnikowia pulcherrima]|nr:hypothetical protein OY671_002218 [Metschnikowia pulcherrima]